jgi:thioredoxin-related protein
MRLLLLLLLLFPAAVLSQVAFDDGSLRDVVGKGFSGKMNVLLVFENSWSPLCKQFKREVFGNSSFDSLLSEHFVVRNVVSAVSENRGAVRYDDTPDGEIARLFKLDGFPTVVILHPVSDTGYTVAARLIGTKNELDQVVVGGDDSFLVDQRSGKTAFDPAYATALIRRYIWSQ